MPRRVAFSLTTAQRLEVDYALGCYAAELRGFAKNAEKLGKQPVADSATAEAGAIDEDLRKRVRVDGQALELAKGEIGTTRSALGRYIVRLKAAAGTLKGLGGHDDQASKLEQEASVIDTRTLAIFGEQTALPLDTPLSQSEEDEIRANEAEARQKLERLERRKGDEDA